MLSIYKKELKSYFINMTGYVFIAFLMLIVGVLCLSVNFIGGYPSFETSLATVSLIMLLIVPILTMKAWAEEKQLKTDNLLYSLPIRVREIVIGKYFAMITVFLISVAIMSVYPIILSFYGTVHILSAYSSILGFFLFGATLISIGMFVSSLTESQIISAVLTFAVVLVIFVVPSLVTLIPPGAYTSLIAFTVLVLLFAAIVYALTKNSTVAFIVAIAAELILYILFFVNSSIFEGAFARLMSTVSIYDRLVGFINGIFDLTSVLYYISIIFVFLFLTSQSVEKRRWS